MNIGFLTASVIPSTAATSLFVVKLAEAFAQHGHDVTLFCIAPRVHSDSDDHRYYGVDPSFGIIKSRWPRIRGLGGFIYGLRTRKKLRSLGPVDLLYGLDPYSLLMLASERVPLIYEAQNRPLNKLRARLEGRLFQQPNFSRLVVISDPLRKEYSQRFYGLSPDRILLAACCAAEPNLDAAKLDEWPGRDGRMQVGYVGSLYPGRGIDLIVDLANKSPEIDFHVIGGSDVNLAHWTRHSHPNLRFHGFLSHGTLSSYYRELDVLLAPYQRAVSVAGGNIDSAEWMSPLKLFEYMSYGKAIICSDHPVLQSILTNNQNALLCPPDDRQAWHDALTRLDQDLALRARLGASAREEFEQRYSLKSRAQIVLGVEN